MPRMTDIYLDIETSWSRRITVIGFYSRATGLVQLVGKDISRRRLLGKLPKSGRLFTYNGHAFDLSVIKKKMGLDFRERYDSWDLRWICQRQGITGGQKIIEDQIGYCRVCEAEGLDGRDAIYLWERYKRGDENDLKTLLTYNAEDIYGLKAIATYLRKSGLLNK